MSRRYSRVRRGAEYNEALTKYITYLQSLATRDRKLNTRGPRDLSKTAYILPFTAEVGTAKVQVRANPDQYSILSPFILGGSTKADITDVKPANVVTLPKFSPARINFFRNNTRVVAVKRSEITGLEYLKYTGNRFSCPFGASTDADDEMEAFLDVKAAILAAHPAYQTKRVSLGRERVGIETA